MRGGLFVALVLAAIGVLPAGVAAGAEPPRPNVLLIIADDLGYGDLGFTGNRDVRTPRLDRLARESAVLRNFVVAPACSPSRAALLTGRDHLATGVWGVPPRANLQPDERRMPEYFQRAGYATAHIGKLDSVKVAGRDGQHFGWAEWTGGGGYEQRDPMVFSSRGHRRESGWTVDLWTDRAIRFVSEPREEPWLLTLAYIVPHLPWQADERFIAPFRAAGLSEELAACYGAIAQMDENIGRLLDALRETGQEERTIVVFVSDNGATAPAAKRMDGEGRVSGKDWARRNVAGLRGAKATVWEGGIRVPLLISWSGVVPPGERTQFGRAEDVLPTLIELAGLAVEPGGDLPLHGVSLAPALRDPARSVAVPAAFRLAINGPDAPRDLPAWQERRYEDHHLTLREGRFKLHARPGGRLELYELEADPGETTDVAARFPDEVARLAAECRRRWEDTLAGGRAFAPAP